MEEALVAGDVLFISSCVFNLLFFIAGAAANLKRFLKLKSLDEFSERSKGWGLSSRLM
jgi:hypothetical protein